MLEFIKSPLNYTGNKYRILPQITKYFPQKIDTMVDLFCGGATVGLNVECNKIIFVDSNKRVIGLLVYLSKQKIEPLIENIERLIDEYNLSNSYKEGYSGYRVQCSNRKDNNGLKDYNQEGYYRLREDYNNLEDKDSDKANLMLYTLMVYAFNNDIRFNSEGKFNLPIGKTDLNKNNVNKLKEYIQRVSEINAEFVCADFGSKKLKNIVEKADFIYMDPPYLVGDAVYNASWTNKEEYMLLDLIDYFIETNKNFALSNVMAKVGKTNEPLAYWCHKNETLIDIH
ncbi:MAG: Dam family site-specific DNA-(adenine-N6)-methyltransferase, partial [Clostridia bacterium]